MKAGLDQMTAWLLAIVLSSALFGAGYGVTRLAGRGDHPGEGHGEAHGASHGDDHGSGHGDAHGAEHGDSHGASDGHSASGHGDHDESKSTSHGNSHGANHDGHGVDSHGGNDQGHGDADPKGHDGGHGNDHDKAPHKKESHQESSHGGDGHGNEGHGGHDGASHKAPPSASANAFADEDSATGVKWGYTGAVAPTYWADLNPGFSLCRKGREQSPIDIDDTGTNPKLLPIRFLYKEANVTLENSGLAVDAIPGGVSYVEVDGERYDLRRVRFHTPSEHKVAGAPYDMEMQLLHRSADGDRVHISVFFEEGSPNKALDKLWAHLPEEVGRAGESALFNVETLLPGRRVYFHYKGSLTTPPCTEGVKWFVLSQSVEASSKQIDQLSNLVMRNIRPISPLHGRKVTRSSR